jgi:hypothetical protein
VKLFLQAGLPLSMLRTLIYKVASARTTLQSARSTFCTPRERVKCTTGHNFKAHAIAASRNESTPSTPSGEGPCSARSPRRQPTCRWHSQTTTRKAKTHRQLCPPYRGSASVGRARRFHGEARYTTHTNGVRLRSTTTNQTKMQHLITCKVWVGTSTWNHLRDLD